uniref:Taste receptor type 2 n=1 Tax=Vombatus ursinus TaxID=29139 RepID=A0A4X2M0L6_VOMUR
RTYHFIGEKILMALATAEFLLGILVNGFIVLVNGIDCVKSKKLPPCDLILVILAISIIELSCTIIWNSYLILISFDVPTRVRVIDVFVVLTHNSNIWFSTILSIFYFLKIINFSNPLFLWMKWRIDRMLFMLFWRPLIISLSIIFPMVEIIHYYHRSIFSGGKKRNVSQEVQVSKSKLLVLHVFFGLLSIVPFTLSTIFFSLLFVSLWRHTRQMQHNATAVSSFLILILLYYMGFFVIFWNHSEAKSKLASNLGTSIMLLYPFGHSLILILWNGKLRQASLWVRHQALFCLRGRKP